MLVSGNSASRSMSMVESEASASTGPSAHPTASKANTTPAMSHAVLGRDRGIDISANANVPPNPRTMTRVMTTRRPSYARRDAFRRAVA